MRFVPSRWVLVALLLMVSACAVAQTITPSHTTVVQSVHNLSVDSLNPIKSDTEKGVCIFCHAPHNTNGAAPLWNKQLPTANFQLYTSSTYKQPQAPLSDRSKLCLSCHDGTIGLGQTIASGDLNVAKSMPSTMGPDLTRDHPVSFSVPVQDDGEVSDWLHTPPAVSPDPTVKISNGRVECVTCHDPHIQDNDATVKDFLVRDNQGGGLCLNCHDGTRGALKGFIESQHMQSTTYYPTIAANLPYDTVAHNACTACHTSHNAPGSGPRLLRGVEEAGCFNCHSSTSVTNPPATDVLSSFSKTYTHPVTTVSGVHDTGETLPVNSARHSECEDCHNPHGAQKRTDNQVLNAPALLPSLISSSGVSSTGSPLVNVQYEYEVCFKCHAGSNNKPQQPGYTQYGIRTPMRQSQTGLNGSDIYDTSKEFASGFSRHNVTSGRSGYYSSSLRDTIMDLNGTPTGRSLLTGQIYCTDCHNSDDAKYDGGAGKTSGPHGSNWEHLLQRQYQMNAVAGTGASAVVSPVAYSPGTTYAICEKCHKVDEVLIQGTDPVFGKHNVHVVSGKVSCASCHAPHGVQLANGGGHAGLVDVDTAVATKLDGTPITSTDNVIDTGTKTCNLICHGYTHTNKTYPN